MFGLPVYKGVEAINLADQFLELFISYSAGIIIVITGAIIDSVV